MLKSLTIVQGDTMFLRFPFLKDGAAWPVAGWRFWFTVKVTTGDPDSAAVFQKSTDNSGIRLLSSTVLLVTIDPTDTKTAPAGKHHYDFQASSPEGDILTLEIGTFTIVPEVTSAP